MQLIFFNLYVGAFTVQFAQIDTVVKISDNQDRSVYDTASAIENDTLKAR